MNNITPAEVVQTCCASSRSEVFVAWLGDIFSFVYSLPRCRQKATMEQKNEIKVNDSVLHVQSYSIIST